MSIQRLEFQTELKLFMFPIIVTSAHRYKTLICVILFKGK
jgi:hypothetical protein